MVTEKENRIKRSILVSKLSMLIELDYHTPVAQILKLLTSSIGEEKKNIFKMSDSEFLGLVEKAIKKVEDGEEDY